MRASNDELPQTINDYKELIKQKQDYWLLTGIASGVHSELVQTIRRFDKRRKTASQAFLRGTRLASQPYRYKTMTMKRLYSTIKFAIDKAKSLGPLARLLVAVAYHPVGGQARKQAHKSEASKQTPCSGADDEKCSNGRCEAAKDFRIFLNRHRETGWVRADEEKRRNWMTLRREREAASGR